MISSRDACRLALLLAPALLGGCTYTYDNPAQDLGTGELAGRVVVAAAGGVTPAPGVTVALRQSYNSTYTRDTGRYFLYGMMPGRHTVLFSAPPNLALQRDVEMVWGADGQPEGVVLGDVQLRKAVTLQGSVTAALLPPGASSFQASTAWVVDGQTGQSLYVYPTSTPPLALDGSFSYALAGLPTGPHELRWAVDGTLFAWVQDPITLLWSEQPTGPGTFVGGPVAVDVPDAAEGTKLQLTDAPLAFADPATLGKLRFQAAVAGASWAGGFDAQVWDLTNSVAVAVPAPDSTSTYELDLPPGRYQVTVKMPLTYTGPLVVPPATSTVVVAASTAELGTFYAVDPATVTDANFACLTDQDCATKACQGGQCVQPACLAGDFTVECAQADYNCTMMGTTTPCAGGKGICAGTSVAPACVPQGSPACQVGGQRVDVPFCRPN